MICSGEQFLSLRMMSSGETSVCTMRLFPGVGGYLAVNYLLMVDVTSQSFLETFHDPLLENSN